MPKRDTKERILDEALNLFSVRGFEGVSVKEIAGAVGIKDSSLYKHYKGKQDIFDTLLDRMNRLFSDTVARYSLPQGSLPDMAREYGESGLEWLKQTCETIFLFFSEDPYASKFRRMLTIEQYKNSVVGKTFRTFYIDGALDFQSALFEEMMRKGYFKKADPMLVAVEFYAPIYLLLNLFDADSEGRDRALEMLYAHVEQFSKNYSI